MLCLETVRDLITRLEIQIVSWPWQPAQQARGLGESAPLLPSTALSGLIVHFDVGLGRGPEEATSAAFRMIGRNPVSTMVCIPRLSEPDSRKVVYDSFSAYSNVLEYFLLREHQIRIETISNEGTAWLPLRSTISYHQPREETTHLKEWRTAALPALILSTIVYVASLTTSMKNQM